MGPGRPQLGLGGAGAVRALGRPWGGLGPVGRGLALGPNWGARVWGWGTQGRGRRPAGRGRVWGRPPKPPSLRVLGRPIRGY